MVFQDAKILNSTIGTFCVSFFNQWKLLETGHV